MWSKNEIDFGGGEYVLTQYMKVSTKNVVMATDLDGFKRGLRIHREYVHQWLFTDTANGMLMFSSGMLLGTNFWR